MCQRLLIGVTDLSLVSRSLNNATIGSIQSLCDVFLSQCSILEVDTDSHTQHQGVRKLNPLAGITVIDEVITGEDGLTSFAQDCCTLLQIRKHPLIDLLLRVRSRRDVTATSLRIYDRTKGIGST